eukprot:8287414-Pyramimonas_sp.AAC.1
MGLRVVLSGEEVLPPGVCALVGRLSCGDPSGFQGGFDLKAADATGSVPVALLGPSDPRAGCLDQWFMVRPA